MVYVAGYACNCTHLLKITYCILISVYTFFTLTHHTIFFTHHLLYARLHRITSLYTSVYYIHVLLVLVNLLVILLVNTYFAFTLLGVTSRSLSHSI